MTAIEHIVATLTEKGGFRTGTSLENRVAYRLARLGFTGATVAQQYRVGRYKLDFAWPELKIALEADGWHHFAPESAARDARRDKWLREQGWLVFRVTDDGDPFDGILDQLARVTEVVHALRACRR